LPVAARIRFDQSICANLDAALQREWLETNGLGGFASSTIIGLNTRRYHGLLVAATRPPVGRMVLLSKLEETLVVRGQRCELSANRYPGVVHPRGYQYVREFRLDPFPVVTYHIQDLEIEKRIFMVSGENTTVVEYELRGAGRGSTLEVRPLIAFRDYHATTHANDALNAHVDMADGCSSVSPYPGLPTLYLAHDAASAESTGTWYYDFEFDRERERGLDFQEDLFNPLLLTFNLAAQARATIIASTERREAAQVPAFRQAEIERRAGRVGGALRPQPALTPEPDQGVLRGRGRPPHRDSSDDPFIQSLVAAADQFIVRRGEFHSVIAGYPWFSDWGRDIMISLPGLTLVTRRPDLAKSILLGVTRYVDQGMLPNRFPDSGETPDYNTVDATLWFFEAVDAFVRYTGDVRFVKNHLYEKMVSIIGWHERGTRYGIHLSSDGFIESGHSGAQLTWMDAKVGDWVVTPRAGKPVEVQALWYNALLTLEELARKFDDVSTSLHCSSLADLARSNFVRLFWNEQAGCLYDVLDGTNRDPSIRPNQILAVSLPHSMLPPDKAGRVLGVVQRELLTPYGLRSLAPVDPQYRDRYEGDQRSRDSAYHQGTVWPWLMGPFITAYVKVNGRTKETRDQVARWLVPFREHLYDAGIGQISEIFDGDPPHHPRGCIAQAWSVAEILRAAVELR
jgi:glycogen debranching enzyme